jgi:hypothetical protein
MVATFTQKLWETDCASLVCELVDLTLVFRSLVHVARVVWLGWRHMVPDNFQWGNGDGSFSQMSRGSLFFVRTVEVLYTDVVGNVSPTLAFLRGICLGVARLWSGEGYLKG